MVKEQVKYLRIPRQYQGNLLNELPSWVQILINDLAESLKKTNSEFARLKGDQAKLLKSLEEGPKVPKKTPPWQQEMVEALAKLSPSLRKQFVKIVKDASQNDPFEPIHNG